MSVIIDVFGTLEFFAEYSASKLSTERDWFENQVWEQIDTSATVYSWTDSKYQVDCDSHLEDDRMVEADNYLEKYFDYYSSSDCCIVLDYYPVYDNWVGYAYQCTAGDSVNKTALVDYGSDKTYSFDDLNPPQRRYLGQEPGHVFCAEHNEGGVTSSGEVTFMWESKADTYCYQNSSKDTTIANFTYCSDGTIDDNANKEG